MEQMGLIALSDAVHSPAKLKITANREQLYKLQVEKPGLETLVQLLLRTYPGIFDDHVILQTATLASKLKLDFDGLVSRLHYLEGIGFADFSKPSDKPMLTMLLPRQSPAGLSIDLAFVDSRRKEYEHRLQAILNYIGNNHDCRTVQLCAYFGESDTERCGICDVCLDRNKTKLNDRRFDMIRQQIIDTLSKEAHSLPYLTQVLGLPEEDSLQVIRFMIDHQELREEKGKLIWQGKSK
jgi:ATP-dependent DNA helicase RecQ